MCDKRFPSAVRLRRFSICALAVSAALWPQAVTAAGENNVNLVKAAGRGKLKTVEKLLDRGADPDSVDRFGFTALQRAVQGSEAEVVRLLLQRGADADATGGSADLPPLHRAAKEDSIELARLLIDAGAEVDRQIGTGDTALLAAVEGGSTEEVVRLLLDSGANPSLAAVDGRCPLVEAVKQHSAATVKAIADHPAMEVVWEQQASRALERAVKARRAELAVMLLDRGASPHGKGADGEPLIYRVAEWGEIEVLAAMLTHGANVNATCSDGRTPLFIASLFGSRDVVEALLEAGADVGLDRQGWTPLDAARDAGSEEVLELLKEAGAEHGTMPAGKCFGISTVAPTGEVTEHDICAYTREGCLLRALKWIQKTSDAHAALNSASGETVAWNMRMCSTSGRASIIGE